MSRSRIGRVALFVCAVFGLAPQNACAGGITLYLDEVISGAATAPSGNMIDPATGASAWASATFTDVSSGVVQVTLDAGGLNQTGSSGPAGTDYQHLGAGSSSGGVVTSGAANNSPGWFFNLPSSYTNTLTIGAVTKTVDPHQTTFATPKIVVGTPPAPFFNTTGGGPGMGTTTGNYTLNVQFSEGDSASEFQYGDKVTFTISGTGLTASMFDTTSSGTGGGTYTSAAWIENGEQGWIGSGLGLAVPEPSSWALLGIGVSAAWLVGWRRRKKLHVPAA
jgi:hypothetical protein